MDGTSLGQSLVRQSDIYGTVKFSIITHVQSLKLLTVFTQQSNQTADRAPNGILDWRSGNFRQGLLLLGHVYRELLMVMLPFAAAAIRSQGGWRW